MQNKPIITEREQAISVCCEDFYNRINEFVESYLRNYTPAGYNDNKVIHDPVWGTSLFYKWELEILDSPLLQRLRDISQLGLAMLTYPSARHTRFEHTLGVMSVVTKMVNHINQKDPEKPQIIKDDFYILRLAALLHDVGHCFCSHLSESIYGRLKEFNVLKKSVSIFRSAKEHEIFSYLIINSDSFKAFIREKTNLWSAAQDINELFRNIGCIILGEPLPEEIDSEGIIIRKYYLTQIINGSYDADKLDYLRRDSYTAGLALTYDIDRFLYKIRIADKDEEIEGKKICGKHLVIPISGISAVEEMAFSQLMLASYIYQHQKVLATDELIKDIVEGLYNNGKLVHPCDFLKYCDTDIFKIYSDNADEDFRAKIGDENFSSVSDKKLSYLVKRVKNRELPKRAFTVNSSTVMHISDERPIKYTVADIADRLAQTLNLRKEICETALEISEILPEAFGGNKQIDMYDIFISIPKTSIAKNLSSALVINNVGKFIILSDIVRLSDWADAFSSHKWNAYIFATVDILPIVSVASKIVLERHGMQFDEETVFYGIKEVDKINVIIKYLKENEKYPK